MNSLVFSLSSADPTESGPGIPDDTGDSSFVSVQKARPKIYCTKFICPIYKPPFQSKEKPGQGYPRPNLANWAGGFIGPGFPLSCGKHHS
jgi:hypothetical protein